LIIVLKDFNDPFNPVMQSTLKCPKRHETDMAKCFNHARHNFCELLEVWPTEALIAIELINILFMNDRLTKKMSLEERLKYHQQHSTQVLKSSITIAITP